MHCAYRHLAFSLVSATLLTVGIDAAAAREIPVQVDQSRGVDSRVDYSKLLRYGPWDDRNYELTVEDLALLARNESELKVPVPAFYRVELRRTFDLEETGPVQYPHSALPRFLNEYGGYLVDGKLYRGLERRGDDWVILDDETADLEDFEREGGFAFLEGESRVTSPNGAAESAIAINPANPDLVIAGTNGPSGSQRMHFSSDGGETWTQATNLPLGGACCDPTVAWSADGSKAYTATLGSGVWFYRSGDNGHNWDDLANEPGADPRRELGSGVDKEYLHVDTYPTSPRKDSIYLTWHQGNIMQFARSLDFGHTWSTPLAFTADDRGIGSDIATDSAGDIYYFYPAFNTQTIRLKKSTDGGVSFGAQSLVADTEGSFIFPVPSMETREVFIYVSAAVDLSGGPFHDTIYAAWTDSTGPTTGNPANNHARIQVAFSRNGGSSWTVTTPHETDDASTVDRYHQWLGVAPDGSVHVVFYDTRRDLPSRNQVDMFHSVSTDGGVTWSTPDRLTAEQSPNITTSFEFGDYNGLDVVMNDVIAIYTDNRNESGGGGNSVDVYAAGQVTSNTIFTDDFESGDTSAWTTAVP
ncbi:MAG: sialidase family protein [Thermoanaerobaculia bacterium]